MSYSRTLKIAALLGTSAILLPSTAMANCGNTCVSAHSSSHHSSSHGSYDTPMLSSWTASPSYTAPATSYTQSTQGSSYTGSSHHSGSSHAGSAYTVNTAMNCPTGTMPQSDGTCLDTSGSYGASYGSGSISSSYSGGSPALIPFTSSASIPGLGANESLVPTSCPVSVSNPEGGRVIGCYAVSKPAPVVQAPVMRAVTTYTRVVRPVIYVRYPVPTPVPYIQDVYVGGCGGYNTRYGSGYPGSCGW